MKLQIFECVKCNGAYVPISHCISVCKRLESRDKYTNEVICNKDYEKDNYYKKSKNKKLTKGNLEFGIQE